MDTFVFTLINITQVLASTVTGSFQERAIKIPTTPSQLPVYIHADDTLVVKL